MLNRLLRIPALLILVGIFTSSLRGADSEPVLPVQITGGDEAFKVDVVLDAGVHKLAVLSTTVVEQVFGQDPQGTTFFFFGATLEDADGIGLAGDTVRVQIPAAVTPLNAIYPAVDVTYTLVAGDISSDNPERTVALNTCTALKADANFNTAEWDCDVARDFAYVHINSELFNEFGHRTTWTVTCSGTTVCNEGESDIDRRGKSTELSRSPNDPARLGFLSISGTVINIPGGTGDILIEQFVDGGSVDMRVDGSSTPVEFDINCDAIVDKLVNEIRIFAGCNGLKFGQFLCKNTTLANGIKVEIQSTGDLLTLPLLFNTEDFKNKFSFGPAGPTGNFRFDSQAGADQMAASFVFDSPAIIETCGTNSPDDFLRITIQDDLTGSSGGNLQEFEGIVQGFKREP